MMTLDFRQSELWTPCRREWALGYRAGLVRRRQRPNKAGQGTLVHKGLEHLYLGDDWDPPMTALWEESAATIEDRPDWLQEYEKQLVLARTMMYGYVQWLEETGADAGWTVTSVERRLRAHWGDFDVPDVGLVRVYVSGQADLEVLDEYDQPLLVDHKTRDSLASKPQDGMDQQRLTYGVLRMMEDGTFYRGAIHNILRRVGRSKAAKPPFYGRNAMHFSMEQLRRHELTMRAKIQEMVPLAAGIKAGTVDLDDPRLFPVVGRDDDWKCPFIDVCPLFDDGSDWAWSLNELFEPGATMEITPTKETI